MTRSRTDRESFFAERIFGDDHYKTTISNDEDQVVGRGDSAKEAEKIASEKWDEVKDD
jgi:hypothetical protein